MKSLSMRRLVSCDCYAINSVPTSHTNARAKPLSYDDWPEIGRSASSTDDRGFGSQEEVSTSHVRQPEPPSFSRRGHGHQRDRLSHVRQPDAYLTRRITISSSVSEIISWVRHPSRGGKIHPIHVGAAFVTARHLVSDTKKDHSSDINTLLNIFEASKDSLGPRQVSNCLWAVSKLPSSSLSSSSLERYRSSMIAASTSHLMDSTTQELSCQIYAMARLRWNPGRDWAHTFMDACSQHMSLGKKSFSLQEVSMIIWAIGTMKWDGEILLACNEVERRDYVEGRGEDFSLWLQLMLDAQTEVMASRHDHYGLQELSMSIWGLARIGFFPPQNWWEAFSCSSASAMASCSRPQGQETSCIIWAFTSLLSLQSSGVLSKDSIPQVAFDLFAKSLEHVRSIAALQQLEVRHSITCLYSASLVPMLVKDSWLSNMISAIHHSSSSASSSLRSTESAVFIIALARLSSSRPSFKHPSLRDQPFLEALLEEASTSKQIQGPMSMSINPPIVLLWSCARLNLRPPLSFLALVQKSTYSSLSQGLSSKELSSIIWSMGRLRVRPGRRWMQEFIVSFQRSVKTMSLQELTQIAWGLPMCLGRNPRSRDGETSSSSHSQYNLVDHTWLSLLLREMHDRLHLGSRLLPLRQHRLSRPKYESSTLTDMCLVFSSLPSLADLSPSFRDTVVVFAEELANGALLKVLNASLSHISADELTARDLASIARALGSLTSRRWWHLVTTSKGEGEGGPEKTGTRLNLGLNLSRRLLSTLVLSSNFLMHQMSVGQMCYISYSFQRLGIKPGQGWMDSLCQESIQRGLENHSVRELSSMLSTLGRMTRSSDVSLSPRWIELALKQVEVRSPRILPNEFVGILVGISSLSSLTTVPNTCDSSSPRPLHIVTWLESFINVAGPNCLPTMSPELRALAYRWVMEVSPELAAKWDQDFSSQTDLNAHS